MITGFEIAQQRRADRRHAGRRRPRRFRTFERAHTFLEHRHCRVRVARVDEAAGLVLEALLGLLGAVVDIALGEKQCFGSLAVGRTHQRAAVDKHGFGLPSRLAVHVLRHDRHGAALLGSAGKCRKSADRSQQKTRFNLARQRPSGQNQVRARPFSEFFNVAASRPAKSPRKRLIALVRADRQPPIVAAIDARCRQAPDSRP